MEEAGLQDTHRDENLSPLPYMDSIRHSLGSVKQFPNPYDDLIVRRITPVLIESVLDV